MNLFGNLPQERAMSTLIHDTNNSSSIIGSYLNFIKRATTDKDILEDVEKAKNALKTLLSKIDDYYVKFKKDFTE